MTKFIKDDLVLDDCILELHPIGQGLLLIKYAIELTAWQYAKCLYTTVQRYGYAYLFRQAETDLQP